MPLPKKSHWFKSQYLPVGIAVRVQAITSLNEVEQSFQARFQMTIGWKDYRLSYETLKPNRMDNILGHVVAEKLWIPPLYISSSRSDNSHISYGSRSTIAVSKESQHAISGPQALHETYEFPGRSNTLLFMQTYDLEHICHFKLQYYPFDTQVCSINVTVLRIFENKVKLYFEPSWMKYMGERYLHQFEMVSMKTVTDNNNKTVQVKLVLRRLLANHLVSTFFPTICLMVIGCVTLFIDQQHFEATIMVSLTTMLVTYTLHQSISASLPKTGTVKLIDIWLLIGLILPFIVFLCLVIIEILPDNDKRNIVVTSSGGTITEVKCKEGLRKRFTKWVRIFIMAFSLLFVAGFLIGSLHHHSLS